MSGIMLLLSVCVSLCLLRGTGGSARSEAVILRDALERGPASLNDMFREVEELMEDTQHILEEAVDQITTESAKSSLTSPDLSLHNETQRTDKETNNKPGETRPSHVHVELSGPWNSVDHKPDRSNNEQHFDDCGEKLEETSGNNSFTHVNTPEERSSSFTYVPCNPEEMSQECIVDEDCGDLRYCLYEIQNSRCLPCIPTDMPCIKDEECCSDQMCVWGQCTVNATRGTEGTICQGQSDCRTDLCCAFQRELLFPVCNPHPGKGESCLNYPNLLMDMLAWDEEVPRDHCPCADHLQCQPQGRGSVCGE